MMKQFKFLFSMLTLLLLTVMLSGQGSTTSSMSGKITDSSGGPLAGASIIATHVPSGTMYGAIVNNAGLFTIQGMRPGGPL